MLLDRILVVERRYDWCHTLDRTAVKWKFVCLVSSITWHSCSKFTWNIKKITIYCKKWQDLGVLSLMSSPFMSQYVFACTEWVCTIVCMTIHGIIDDTYSHGVQLMELMMKSTHDAIGSFNIFGVKAWFVTHLNSSMRNNNKLIQHSVNSLFSSFLAFTLILSHILLMMFYLTS